MGASMGKRIGLSGLSSSDMKRHYAIIPMHFIAAGGITLAASYLTRLATKHPEVTWRRKANPEPWNEYSCKQYKFLSAGRDYSECTPAPRYK